MKASLQNTFEKFISSNNLFQKNNYLLVACSGGVDSVLLCHLLYNAGYAFDIAHCNFQLRGAESDADENFVRLMAQGLSANIYVERFETEAFATANKVNIQIAARQLRYSWFNELIAEQKKPAYILTAHHADDNIETVLMNLFKGTGISGTHGILSKNGNIVRPILFARKEEILQYANELSLQWREDASNATDKYTRNFFRHHIIPEIEKVVPNAANNFLETIAHLKEAEVIYKEAIALRKKKLLKPVGQELHIPCAKLMNEKAVETVALEIIKDFGFTNQQLPDFINLLQADTGKYIVSATHRIIKNRNWLIVAPLQLAKVSAIVIEEGERKVHFNNAVLQLQVSGHCIPSAKKEEAWLDLAKLQFPLILRPWKQGDYFYPLGMPKKKKINRFLIDQKLSATEKENVWVLESNKKIMWVVGYRIDDRFKITASSSQALIITYKK